MWYIDSWAVLDGLAFASERDPESLDAKATIFLSVPDLEPVPVGRLSTALRAQRACFQDGFRGDDGSEVGLESLDQVRELVRRAYLGGGLGPEPTPVEPRPVNPLLQEPRGARGPSRDWPSGGSYYDNSVLEHPNHFPSGQERMLDTDFSALQWPKSRQALLRRLYQSDAALDLYPLLRAFGEATILEFLHQSAERLAQPDERALLDEWISTLWAIGLWSPDEGQGFFGRLKQHGLEMGGLGRYWHDPGFIPALAPATKEMLFHVPCPLRPEWDRHIGNLSHKLLLALAVRRYFKINSQLAEFIPILLCSLVAVVGPKSRLTGSVARLDIDRQRLLGRAFLWLIGELPSIELPAAVELYLERFAMEQLTLNPER